jgi:hypothetical protein
LYGSCAAASSASAGPERRHVARCIPNRQADKTVLGETMLGKQQRSGNAKSGYHSQTDPTGFLMRCSLFGVDHGARLKFDTRTLGRAYNEMS